MPAGTAVWPWSQSAGTPAGWLANQLPADSKRYLASTHPIQDEPSGRRRLTRDSQNRRLTRDSRISNFFRKKICTNRKNRFFGFPGPK